MRSQISLRDANPFGLASAAAVERMLADIRGLAPDIAARAAEFEAARRIPLELVETLRSIGVFRIFAPRSHGGLELALPQAVEIIAALSRIDGSVGWDAMIGSTSGLFLPLLPRETYDRILDDGPDVICAGSITPTGTAEPAPGGAWRVSGRWPFASGCEHADWILGFCVVTRDGRPVPGPGGEAGPPRIRGFALPARDWRIEDTWHVAGLKGTGSHHVSLQDALVPEEQFFDFPGSRPSQQGPLYQAVRHLLPLLHGAFCTGMAEGALAELVALAGTGRQQLRALVPMRESEVFQSDLGRIAAGVRAARAYHRAQVESHWRHAVAGTLQDDALYAEGTQAGIWIAGACVHAADACFTLAGGAALYDSSPLQRRLRDLHAAAQHAVVHQRHYVEAGRALLDRAV
ncbi:acyl-CoA dehydrogenase family protein [Inquilinus sp.]|jgi:alkylation response protein AidB-like acyl-CoA dehydrogenase|uniref:acyl-CoA dehydrogenase family protein n=1 Tax=Inquilinus sp. TaxID=1932117 RepID=UPI0037851238